MIDSYSIIETFKALINVTERIERRAQDEWGNLSLLHEATLKLPDNPWATVDDKSILWAYLFDTLRSHGLQVAADLHLGTHVVWHGSASQPQRAPFGAQMRALYCCEQIRKAVTRPEDVAGTLAAHDTAEEIVASLHERIPSMVAYGRTTLTFESGYNVVMSTISKTGGLQTTPVTVENYRSHPDLMRFLVDMLEKDSFKVEGPSPGLNREVTLCVDWRG